MTGKVRTVDGELIMRRNEGMRFRVQVEELAFYRSVYSLSIVRREDRKQISVGSGDFLLVLSFFLMRVRIGKLLGS